MSEQILHLSVEIQINDNQWSNWGRPNSSRQINVNLPADLFHSPLLVKKIEAMVKEAQAEFPQKVAEFEAEVARKEAEAEAQKLVDLEVEADA